MLKKFLCTRETNKLKALKIKGQFNVAVLHKHKRTKKELPPLVAGRSQNSHCFEHVSGGFQLPPPHTSSGNTWPAGFILTTGL